MKPKTLKLINNISDLISEPSLLKPLSHSALIPGNCREIARTPGETNKQNKNYKGLQNMAQNRK